MKTRLWTIAVLTPLLALPVWAGGTIEDSLKTSPGERLEVDLEAGGDLRITGWSRSEVEVIVHPGGRDQDNVRVEIDEVSTGVRVRSRMIERRRRNSTSFKFEIKVPEQYNLSIETTGGDVTISGVEGEIEGETMGGELDLRDLRGHLDLSTMGGEITLENSDVDGKADTMGGEITIREIDGWVDAETMGGDVHVTMVGDPSQGRRDVNIESMGGEIVLTVPDGLSMNFDIEIEITKRAKREYEIQSDFPVETSERKRRSNRVVVGSGSVGSGEHRIRIRTINGDVEIRRGN